MNKKIISFLLILALLAGSIASLVGCDNQETNTEETVSAFPTESTPAEEPTEEKEDEETSDIETESEEAPDLYGNGGKIDIAGIDWDKDAFALNDYTVDKSAAVEISASELSAMLNAETLEESKVYKVSEPLVIESSLSYDGNFASVIAEGGVIFKNVSDVVVRELIIVGDVKVESSSDLVFFNVDIQGGETAISIDTASSAIAFKGCKISASDTAVKTGAKTVTLFETNLTADNGIDATGDETAIHGCHFINVSSAFKSRGKSCIIRNSTIELSSDGLAIDFENGYNGLIALNRIESSQSSIRLVNSYNCSVILNSAVSISVTDNTNVYVFSSSKITITLSLRAINLSMTVKITQ